MKNNFSFTKQLADVVGDKILTARSVCSIVVDVESEYVCNDVTMREQIISTLKEFHSAGPFACIVKLNSILKILYWQLLLIYLMIHFDIFFVFMKN